MHENLNNKERTGETPFKRVKNVDISRFLHQRALCNIPAGNVCLEATHSGHKHNNQLTLLG